MIPVSSKHQEKLTEIKKNIKASRAYFEHNIERFHHFMKFVFDTAITSEDHTKLDLLNKPPVEFNILEAMISRLRGEFAKHEPEVTAGAAPGVRVEDLTPDFIAQLETIQAHIKAILNNATNDNLEWQFYSDLLGGGYSVAHVLTDYINEMSFEQNIKVERVFDPTMTGFDPLARDSHKGDGAYCFHLIPKTKEEFEEEFGKGKAAKMTFTRLSSLGSFNWSYINQEQHIVLVADYYCKVRAKHKIVKLSNGHVVLKKHYDDFLKLWNTEGFIEQAPIIIHERMSVIETIERYIVCENEVLKHEETFYKMLPLVFFDGNSVNIQDSEGSATTQMTRPAMYHAKGIQQLKNFSGQTVSAEIENMVMHKFIVAKESIPKGYEDAYKNVQLPSTLIYNAFMGETPLPPPREINRTPTPPIVENTFMGTDRVTQTILGNYDAILGISDKQISGVAIQQGAMQSNAAALPYLMGYINGMNRVAQIIVDLIPKIYVTPRSIPIVKENGKRTYQIINATQNPQSIDMMYNPNNFEIKVEAGVNSTVQKQVALDQIIRMMQSSEIFAEFINTMGLETILDNLDIRGIEQLKAQSVIFMKQLEEQKKAAQEAQAQQGDPMEAQMKVLQEIEMAKIEQSAIKTEGDQAIQAAKVANEKQLTDIKFMEAMAKVEQGNVKLAIEQEKIDAENSRSAVETAIGLTKELHERSRANAEDHGRL